MTERSPLPGARRDEHSGPALSGSVVLITGATGFIGRHLCARLHADGAEVHGVSRRQPPSDAWDVSRWWQADLSLPDETARLVRTVQPRCIIHLAARVRGSRDLQEVLPTFQDNLTSTVNVLVAAQEVGCRRLIVAGSREERTAGDTALRSARSPYSAAKEATAHYTSMFRVVYGLDVTRLRIPMVYGPGQMDLTKVVPYTVTSLLTGRRPELTTGETRFDWMFVDDVVEALVRAMASTSAADTVTLGTGRLATVRQVVEELLDLTGARVGCEFGMTAGRPNESHWAAESTDSHLLAGWLPAVTLREGLRRTLDWYSAALQDGRVRVP